MNNYDAVVVGAGPNGLAAAICLTKAGLHTLLIEARGEVGGGCRSQSFSEPDFVHDVCAAVHPMAISSPFFKSLHLDEMGLRFIEPEYPLAHPLLGEEAVVLARSLTETAEGLGVDKKRYLQIFADLVPHADSIFADFVGPLKMPKHLGRAMKFGALAVWPATMFANMFLKTERARALIAGLAAHTILPLEKFTTAAMAIVMALAGHAYGWPIIRGGSGELSHALLKVFLSQGGQLKTNFPITSAQQLPPSRVVLFDLTPRQILAIEGLDMANSYRRKLEKYRYGPSVFKVDWALREPVPWRSPACKRAGSVHIGGKLSEIAKSERLTFSGAMVENPFIVFSQPSLFDVTRAPSNQHTAWAYCHAPHGSTADYTDLIEENIEAHAPGFRDCIRYRHSMNAVDLQRYNNNYVGGDVIGGVMDFWQLFFRPVMSLNPYHIPNSRYYICSSSTPPGAGVHGLCGYFAAQKAISALFTS